MFEFSTETALTFWELVALLCISLVVIFLVGLTVVFIVFLWIEKGNSRGNVEEGDSMSTDTTEATASGERHEIPPQLKILLHDLFGSDSEFESDYEAMLEEMEQNYNGYKAVPESEL